MTHKARKRFGQHFLADLSVIDEIVRAINPQPSDFMVEIGPGQAALTEPLLGRLDHLHVIELDRDLADNLRHIWPVERLNIISQDVLDVDFDEFADNSMRIVGNLPYNISTPLLFHLLKWADKVKDQHFMLQKEIVERMSAKAGDSQYGRLSIMLQMRYKIRYLFDVPPSAFEPPPKVMSAIVRMLPIAKENLRMPLDFKTFDGLIHQAFNHRRKMLRASLGDLANKLDWDSLSIKPTMRPQELTIDQYLDMADAIYNLKLNNIT